MRRHKPSRIIAALLKPYLFTSSASKTVTTTMKTIEEADVGISCYISKLPGFRGILKQRYSDFIVNEVDFDGKVVHLTSLDAPPELREEKKESLEDRRSYDSEIEAFRSLCGEIDAENLKSLIDQIASGVKDDISPIVLSPSSDKSHRTAVHNFFKEKLKFLVTDTIDGPDVSSKCIRVRLDGGHKGKGKNSRKRKDRGDKPFDSRGSEDWPEHLGKFLRFHLYKENKETQEAISLIGKMLGIQSRSFGFAGTKDKRSVSTQRVTVFKQLANKVAALNKRLIGIKVGDFCHVKEGLVLGQLLGNRFTITLRGVVADSEDTIKASADSLGKYGFINYFGLQRFGSGTVPTYIVGATLLRGEWKAGASLILDPREGERDDISKAREYYKESDDIPGTLRQLPRHLVAERAIVSPRIRAWLQSLKNCPGNYLQALTAIPRTLRMMYVHSYQSYLWNHAASLRVQKYGIDKVVLGDLVYTKEDCSVGITGCVDLDSEVSCDDRYDCSAGEIPEVDIPDEKKTLVKVVEEEDLTSGKYTIYDVLLPLPGSKIMYPTNDVAEVYHGLAKKDGINLTESAHHVKELSITNMTGGYRKVFQKPMDFEWELLKYTNGNLPLAETDFDQISKEKSLNIATEVDQNSQHTDKIVHSEQDGLAEGKCQQDDNNQKEGDKEMPKVEGQHNSEQVIQTALKLGFTLPSSCYATMAVRELLKTSTSVAFHKMLNN